MKKHLLYAVSVLFLIGCHGTKHAKPNSVPPDPYDKSGKNALTPDGPNEFNDHPDAWKVTLTDFPKDIPWTDIKTISINFDTSGLAAVYVNNQTKTADKLIFLDATATAIRSQDVWGEPDPTYTQPESGITRLGSVDNGENFYFQDANDDFQKAAEQVVTGVVYFDVKPDHTHASHNNPNGPTYNVGKADVTVTFNN